ncbi:hypothetical protein [Altererythrobacter lauratis]|uniref:Porin n=1 Tax=Alteraurantiacibacter lauratis TaxID=2054627 RepID=A0ABV7EC80_9SPHN
MNRTATTNHKGRLIAAAAICALVGALPSAVMAVGMLNGGASGVATPGTMASFTPADADPALTRMIESRSVGSGRMMRFTPAGAINAPADRTVTVVVRVDGEAARAISVRNAIGAVRAETLAEAESAITPTRYNLGLARGYRSFAQAPALSQPLSDASIPDLSTYAPAARSEEPSRFAARVAIEEDRRAAPVAPQTLESLADQRIDVAGSYRLTRNLDVRAGVRYEQDRNRIAPVPNVDQQDSQAVYVGTRFRF